MAREFSRTERLSEQIQRELARLLVTETADPRLRGLPVSGVEVSRDLAHARVYVTPTKPIVRPSDPGRDGEVGVLRALERATPFLRRRLAAGLRIRAVPELHFTLDRTLDEAERIESLLAGARRGAPAPR